MPRIPTYAEQGFSQVNAPALSYDKIAAANSAYYQQLANVGQQGVQFANTMLQEEKNEQTQNYTFKKDSDYRLKLQDDFSTYSKLIDEDGIIQNTAIVTDASSRTTRTTQGKYHGVSLLDAMKSQSGEYLAEGEKYAPTYDARMSFKNKFSPTVSSMLVESQGYTDTQKIKLSLKGIEDRTDNMAARIVSMGGSKNEAINAAIESTAILDSRLPTIGIDLHKAASQNANNKIASGHLNGLYNSAMESKDNKVIDEALTFLHEKSGNAGEEEKVLWEQEQKAKNTYQLPPDIAYGQGLISKEEFDKSKQSGAKEISVQKPITKEDALTQDVTRKLVQSLTAEETAQYILKFTQLKSKMGKVNRIDIVNERKDFKTALYNGIVTPKEAYQHKEDVFSKDGLIERMETAGMFSTPTEKLRVLGEEIAYPATAEALLQVNTQSQQTVLARIPIFKDNFRKRLPNDISTLQENGKLGAIKVVPDKYFLNSTVEELSDVIKRASFDVESERKSDTVASIIKRDPVVNKAYALTNGFTDAARTREYLSKLDASKEIINWAQNSNVLPKDLAKDMASKLSAITMNASTKAKTFMTLKTSFGEKYPQVISDMVEHGDLNPMLYLVGKAKNEESARVLAEVIDNPKIEEIYSSTTSKIYPTSDLKSEISSQTVEMIKAMTRGNQSTKIAYGMADALKINAMHLLNQGRVSSISEAVKKSKEILVDINYTTLEVKDSVVMIPKEIGGTAISPEIMTEYMQQHRDVSGDRLKNLDILVPKQYSDELIANKVVSSDPVKAKEEIKTRYKKHIAEFGTFISDDTTNSLILKDFSRPSRDYDVRVVNPEKPEDPLGMSYSKSYIDINRDKEAIRKTHSWFGQ
jgi:hypothetical protein